MSARIRRLVALAAMTFATTACATTPPPQPQAKTMPDTIDLGSFSISLAVEDLEASLKFYETLGFRKIDGDPAQHWVILRNGEAKIGLFAGMFDANIITFNPKDARGVQTLLRDSGYAIEKPAEDGEGPTHLVVRDPDGNMILVDQH